jgi:D-arabinose 1-dehydrogenase
MAPPQSPIESNAAKPPLSSILPPLIFGTGTFNYQFNVDPFKLDTHGLVASALQLGIRAFDTSPYYGPSEEILGSALSTDFVKQNFPREDYFLLTKVGRIAAEEFDYSPAWVRRSVERSCARLHTSYLDVVYCHDVEFVSDAEVLGAVAELRRLRDEGVIRYVGISGYPVALLARLAELVLRETGRPLDVVMSYANFTLQNAALAGPDGIERLRAAGVDVVPNASLLGMGLLRQEGVPVGGMGDWHPAPNDLREACARAAAFCARHGERLEVIAIRYALETWLSVGGVLGSRGDPASGVPWTRESNDQVGGSRLGVSVMGVSNAAELEKTMQVWRSILDGLEGGKELAIRAGRWERDHEWSLNRKRAVQILAEGCHECLGDLKDFAWDSPHKGFVNKHKSKETEVVAVKEKAAPWPTPEASPEPSSALERAVGEQKLPLR